MPKYILCSRRDYLGTVSRLVQRRNAVADWLLNDWGPWDRLSDFRQIDLFEGVASSLHPAAIGDHLVRFNSPGCKVNETGRMLGHGRPLRCRLSGIPPPQVSGSITTRNRGGHATSVMGMMITLVLKKAMEIVHMSHLADRQGHAGRRQ